MTKPAGTKDFSFAMRLNKELRLLCELFVELFKYGVRETLLPNGTDVCKRILGSIMHNHLVNSWVNSCTNLECIKRKELTLKKVCYC